MPNKRNELFSEKISVGSRTYFFDVKQSIDGTRYLVISESKQVKGDYEHHRVMIFEENLDVFCAAFEKAIILLKHEGKGLK